MHKPGAISAATRIVAADDLGILLSPLIGALAMSLSSVSVISNALRLRFVKPEG